MLEPIKEDIYWVAGILEGEGCFHLMDNKYPQIIVVMIDSDIISRVRDIIKPEKVITYSKTGTGKSCYRFRITGELAVRWMLILYPILGNRRKQKVREVLTTWTSMKADKRQLQFLPLREEVKAILQVIN